MWCLLTIGYFALAVGLHAVTARLNPAGNRVRQFLPAGGAFGTVLLLHLSRLDHGTWLECLTGGAAYAFACELYVFLFTFVTSSISVAMLVSRSPSGGGSLAPAEMVERRLHTMSAAGLLDQDEDRFRLTPRARILVAVYGVLRRLFCHDTPQK